MMYIVQTIQYVFNHFSINLCSKSFCKILYSYLFLARFQRAYENGSRVSEVSYLSQKLSQAFAYILPAILSCLAISVLSDYARSLFFILTLVLPRCIFSFFSGYIVKVTIAYR